MMESVATLRTEQASKYIGQLCKHFAHKVDVSHSDGQGECRFTCGTATMDAHADVLTIRCTASDDDRLKETQHVIESHLLRFAFREELQPLQWIPSSPAATPNTFESKT